MSTSREGVSTPFFIKSIRLVPPARNLARGTRATASTADAGCSARRYSKVFIFSPCEPRLSLAARALRALHCLHDSGIGAATADVAAHTLANLVSGKLDGRGFGDIGGDEASVAARGFVQQCNA